MTTQHTRRRGIPRVGRALTFAVAATIVAALAACGSSSPSSKVNTEVSKGQVNLTLWSWAPDMQSEIDLFEKQYPNIHVKWNNPGRDDPYTKLRTAIKAGGDGAPDVTQIEYQMLPSFVVTHDLTDLTPYGADKLKNDYAPGAWENVNIGGKVWAYPWDSGPMATLYRADLFTKDGIAVPKTWAEFAGAAAKYRAANPNSYLTNFPVNETPFFMALLWQAGAQPIKTDGTKLTINFNDPKAVQVAQYWSNLIKKGLVSTDPDFTDSWNRGFASGKYGSWLTPAWGPPLLQQPAANTSGKWRVAPLPSQDGSPATATWGGSTLAVPRTTKHPAEANLLAQFMMHDNASASLFTTNPKQLFFPSQKSVLDSSTFADQTFPFYGNTPVNQTYIAASAAVVPGWQWSPIQSFLGQEVAKDVAAANGDLVSALNAIQKAAVSYAKQQGFTVSE